MTRLRVGFLPILLVLVLTAATLTAKGNTVRLTVAGPGLPYPVEVGSPDAVAANVYAGNFIGPSANAPDKRLPRYTVSFFVETTGNPVRMMYVVQYVRNPQTGQGFVYLPAHDDEWYRLNVRTILRGQEGEWHAADEAWSNAISKMLPSR
jgi:hypothetical protein